MDAQIARLFVLYEDLRIELTGITQHSIPVLDILDPFDEREPISVGQYRLHYFLRRSIGTIYEFAEGLRLLNREREFLDVKNVFEDVHSDIWGKAVVFFDQNENVIQNIRNDIGGHFGQKAAMYAVANLKPETIGQVERFDRGDRRTDIRFHLAGELAAVALCRHLPSGDVKLFGDLLDKVVMPSYDHATKCVQVLEAAYLWPRLGKS